MSAKDLFRPWTPVPIEDIEEDIIDVVNDSDDERQEAQQPQNQTRNTSCPRLSRDAKKIICHVHSRLLERGCNKPILETSELTGVAYGTVRNILCRENKIEENHTATRPNVSTTSVVESIDGGHVEELKNVIYQLYREKRVPTIGLVHEKLIERQFPLKFKRETLRKILHKLGFGYKTINRRLAIMNSPRLIATRNDFIYKIREFRRQERNIVYLDETWFDTHDILKKGWIDDSGQCFLDVPASRGKRIIILHAGSARGWIPGCLLLSAKNIADCRADYHQDMNHELFEHWFKNTLLPRLPPNSVIVLDNASYHSKQWRKLPTKSSRKAEITTFMAENGLIVPPKTKKDELLQIIMTAEGITLQKTYNVDKMAEEAGHVVLRLPPYYCVLNPIELVWSQLKHRVRKANNTPNLSATVVDVIREECTKIDSELWANCTKHVQDIENSFLLNKPIPEIIINVNDVDDSSDSDGDN